jgi:predicted TIM-barrel fold metal-dependent hydrolase
MLHALATSIPVIDAHIHLFDPTRPGGVPWPPKTDAVLYHPALPARYAPLAQPHGVVGAIAVECLYPHAIPQERQVDELWPPSRLQCLPPEVEARDE